MKKTPLLKRVKIFTELNKHRKEHYGQIKYNRYAEFETDKILKQEFSCVCGKKWEIDYGWNELEKEGKIKYTTTIHHDWKPNKEDL